MSEVRSVFFFPNGIAAVFNSQGQQMPQYQCGWHQVVIEALRRDGIDYRTLPEVLGVPQTSPPWWWTQERENELRGAIEKGGE